MFGLYAKYQPQTMLIVCKNNTSERTAVILPDCTSECQCHPWVFFQKNG